MHQLITEASWHGSLAVFKAFGHTLRVLHGTLVKVQQGSALLFLLAGKGSICGKLGKSLKKNPIITAAMTYITMMIYTNTGY